MAAWHTALGSTLPLTTEVAQVPYPGATLVRSACGVQARIECTLLISDEEPGISCRQTLEGEVEFRLMGLGRLAQRIVVENLEKVYQAMPLVVQRYTSSSPCSYSGTFWELGLLPDVFLYGHAMIGWEFVLWHRHFPLGIPCKKYQGCLMVFSCHPQEGFCRAIITSSNASSQQLEPCDSVCTNGAACIDSL